MRSIADTQISPRHSIMEDTSDRAACQTKDFTNLSPPWVQSSQSPFPVYCKATNPGPPKQISITQIQMAARLPLSYSSLFCRSDTPGHKEVRRETTGANLSKLFAEALVAEGAFRCDYQATPSLGGVLRRRCRCEEYRGNDRQAQCLYTLKHSPRSYDPSVVMWALRDVDLTSSTV